jgi:hypothetical protein
VGIITLLSFAFWTFFAQTALFTVKSIICHLASSLCVARKFSSATTKKYSMGIYFCQGKNVKGEKTLFGQNATGEAAPAWSVEVLRFSSCPGAKNPASALSAAGAGWAMFRHGETRRRQSRISLPVARRCFASGETREAGKPDHLYQVGRGYGTGRDASEVRPGIRGEKRGVT